MGELVMQRQGGEKLAERYVPLDAKERDYADIIKDILNKRPDFIFSTVVGDSTVALYRAYAEAGFDPKTMPIASLTTSEAEISQMDDGLAIGHYTSAPYFQSIDSEANRVFLIYVGKPHIFRCIFMLTPCVWLAMTKSPF
jgi:branched-chain amino acid transport system substrate-binding protein